MKIFLKKKIDQSPESRVQSPESRVQGPVSPVQVLDYAVFLIRHGCFEQYVYAGVYSLLSLLIEESHAHMFSEVSSWR